MVDAKTEITGTTLEATPEYMDDFHRGITEKYDIRYGTAKNLPLDKKVEDDFKDLAARAILRGNCNHGDPYTHGEIIYLIGNSRPVSQEINPIPEVYVTAIDRKRIVGSGFLYQDVGNGENGFLFGVYEDPAYNGHGIQSIVLNLLLRHAKRKRIKKITALMPKFLDTEKFYSGYRFTNIESNMAGEKLYHKMQLLL